MKLRREHRIAAITAAVAVGVPMAAALFVRSQTRALAEHLGTRGGVTARIGSVDADLTGTIRMTDVELGELFSADSIEASVALDSLLAGDVSADEIRVAGPHLALQIDRDGDSDLARLVRRFGSAGSASPSARAAQVRRVVVSSGTLTARIAGIGEIAADAVELVPDAGGVRVITGKVRVRAGNDHVRGELELARSAAELQLPGMTFGRVLAVAGKGTVYVGGQRVAVRDIAIGRLAGSLEARGVLDDSGTPRPIAAELVPPSASSPGFALVLGGTRVPLAGFASLAPRGVIVADGRATGRLIVRRAGPQLHLATDATLSGLRLDHPALAPQPVPIDATLSTALTLSPDAIAIEHATIAMGAARWTASGWLRRRAPMSGQLELVLAEASCMDLFASLPAELRGVVDGIAMTGTFAGRARMSIDLAAAAGEGVELDTTLANRCEVVSEPPAADVTKLVETKHDRWVAIRKLPWFVPDAFVSAEDGRFFNHHGFDLFQIARSLEIDLRDRRLARGGSTISQQLVKNELLTHRRSLDRKVQEALLTWRLEARLEKKTILERYLNIIELGPRIHGLRAASVYWFDILPYDLTIKQAAFLAALTSEPQSMSKRVRHAGGLDPDSEARVETVLRAMRRDGVIDKEQFEEAREKTLRFASTALRREI